jgi:signal transduction histidine kinase
VAQASDTGARTGSRKPPGSAFNEKRLLRLLYLGTLLLLTVVLFSLFRTMQRYGDANEVVRRSNFILIELQNVLFSLKDAEGGSRGFILTHDTSYLEPFTRAQGGIERSILRLDSAASTATDRARVDTLQALAADMFRRIQGQLLLERASGPGLQGLEAERLAAARDVMVRIRANRKNMVEQIEGLRDSYAPQAKENRLFTPLMMSVYFGLALLATALLLWRLFRALGQAERAEEEVQRKVVQLDREMRTREFAERSLRRVLDSSTNSIMAFRSVRDTRGMVVDFELLLANQAAERMLGKAPEQLIGGRFLEIMPGTRESNSFSAFVEVVESGRPHTEERGSPVQDDEWLNIQAVRLLDGFVVTYTDISDRRRAQEVLMESDRLAITGRIARTIAHEVRNPLTNLRMALEQLLDEIGPQRADEMGPYADILKRNIERISQLITDLLESSKPRELDPEPTEVVAILEAAMLAVKDRLSLQQMEGEIQEEEHLPRIMVDPEMVQLALANICINAVEAMEPGKGRLSLAARSVNGGVCLFVRDNGKGIEPENIQRLFEAFYSSRSGGMGLGLTTARTILNAHGVHLNVESEPGRGTMFSIAFPASASVQEV